MDPSELDGLRRRLRLRYELSRLERALWGLFPALALAGVALVLGGTPRTVVTFGAVLGTLAVAALFRGQHAGRAVFPGLAAGLVPLACSLGARSFGHVCAGGHCYSMCLPACFAGGIVAGLVLAAQARRSSARLETFVASSSLALAAGSMGCGCVGLGGVVGAFLGLLLVATPVLLIPVRPRA